MALYYFPPPPPSPAPSPIEYCSPGSLSAPFPPSPPRARSFAPVPLLAGGAYDVPALDRSCSTSSLDSNDSYLLATPESSASPASLPPASPRTSSYTIARPEPVAKAAKAQVAYATRHRLPSLRGIAKNLDSVAGASSSSSEGRRPVSPAVQQRRSERLAASPVAQAASGNFLNRLLSRTSMVVAGEKKVSTRSSSTTSRKRGLADDVFTRVAELDSVDVVYL